MALRHDRSYLNDGCNDRSISPVVTDDGPANAPNCATGTRPYYASVVDKMDTRASRNCSSPRRDSGQRMEAGLLWIHATTGRCEAGARVCSVLPTGAGGI
jgi:hypothetical protein